MALVIVICLQKCVWDGCLFPYEMSSEKSFSAFSLRMSPLSALSAFCTCLLDPAWERCSPASSFFSCLVIKAGILQGHKESSRVSKTITCQTVCLLPEIKLELSDLSPSFDRPRLDSAPLAISASPFPWTEEFLLCRQIPFPDSPVISMLSDIWQDASCILLLPFGTIKALSLTLLICGSGAVLFPPGHCGIRDCRGGQHSIHPTIRRYLQSKSFFRTVSSFPCSLALQIKLLGLSSN